MGWVGWFEWRDIMYKEYRRYMNFKKDSFANIKRELEEKFSIRFPTTGLPTEKEKKEYRKIIIEKIWASYELHEKNLQVKEKSWRNIIKKNDLKTICSEGVIDESVDIYMMLGVGAAKKGNISLMSDKFNDEIEKKYPFEIKNIKQESGYSDKKVSFWCRHFQRKLLATNLLSQNNNEKDFSKFKYTRIKKIWEELKDADVNVENRIIFEDIIGFILAHQIYICVKRQNRKYGRDTYYFNEKINDLIKVVCQIPGIKRRYMLTEKIFQTDYSVAEDKNSKEWNEFLEMIKKLHAYLVLLEWWYAFSQGSASAQVFSWLLNNLKNIDDEVDKYNFLTSLYDADRYEERYTDIPTAEGTSMGMLLSEFGEIEKELRRIKIIFKAKEIHESDELIKLGIGKDIKQVIRICEEYEKNLKKGKKEIIDKIEQRNRKLILSKKDTPDITYAKIQKLILYHRLKEIETVGKFPYV